MPSCSNRRDTFYIATIAFDDLDLSLIQDELNGFSLSREPARRAVVFSARIKTERRGAVFVVLRNLRRGATVDLAPESALEFLFCDCGALAPGDVDQHIDHARQVAFFIEVGCRVGEKRDACPVWLLGDGLRGLARNSLVGRQAS